VVGEARKRQAGAIRKNSPGEKAPARGCAPAGQHGGGDPAPLPVFGALSSPRGVPGKLLTVSISRSLSCSPKLGRAEAVTQRPGRPSAALEARHCRAWCRACSHSCCAIRASQSSIFAYRGIWSLRSGASSLSDLGIRGIERPGDLSRRADAVSQLPSFSWVLGCGLRFLRMGRVRYVPIPLEA